MTSSQLLQFGRILVEGHYGKRVLDNLFGLEIIFPFVHATCYDVSSIATAKEGKVAPHLYIAQKARVKPSGDSSIRRRRYSKFKISFKYWADRSRIREERKSPNSLSTQNDSQEVDTLEF